MTPEAAVGNHGGLGCVQKVKNDLEAVYYF